MKTSNETINFNMKVYPNTLEPFRILKAIYEINTFTSAYMTVFRKDSKGIYKSKNLPNIIIQFVESSYKNHVGTLGQIIDERTGKSVWSKFIKRHVITMQDKPFISNLCIDEVDCHNLDYTNYSPNVEFMPIDIYAKMTFSLFGKDESFIFSKPNADEIIFTDFAHLRGINSLTKLSMIEKQSFLKEFRLSYRKIWQENFNLNGSSYMRI